MHTVPAGPAVVVLASGKGLRFLASGGSCHKLQALLAGRSVLEHTLQAVRDSGLPWYLVQGAYAGMGDSIAAGVQATRNASGWLILPADLPLIQADTLRRVATALQSSVVAYPVYCGQRGHPVGFSAVCGDALAALSGDRGAAAVLRHWSAKATAVPVDDRGVVFDIDQVADLEAAKKYRPDA